MNIKNLSIDGIEGFPYGFKIRWCANIGFGELTVYEKNDSLYADTECMCSNDDKEFMKLIFDKLIDSVTIE